MTKDQNPDPRTGIPEDAESDDDTLDLTEAMAVKPAPPSEPEEEETVDLASVTTLTGDDRASDAPGPPETSAEAEEEVIDLAAAAGPATESSPEEDEDEEFGRPQATVAISPQELAGLGLSKPPEPDSPPAEDVFPGDDTLREQPTDINTDFGFQEADEATEETLDTPAPEDEDDRFLDIDTGTLVAMGRELESEEDAPDATLVLGEPPDDDEVIDLGTMASPARIPDEPDAVRDAETVIAPRDEGSDEEEPLSTGAPIRLSEADLADDGADDGAEDGADDWADEGPVDPNAATVFMPGGPASEADAADSPARSGQGDPSDRDAATIFMPAGLDDETEVPELGPSSETDEELEDVQTLLLAPRPENEEKSSSAQGDGEPAEISGDWETAGSEEIPAGGFFDLDRPATEEEEAVDPSAETMFFSDWADDDEETGDGNLTALELLDSISGLPDHGEDADSDNDLQPLEEDGVIPDAMEELYGLMETSRLADPDLGSDVKSGSKSDSQAESEPDSETPEAERRESETKAGTATEGKASGKSASDESKSTEAAGVAADSGSTEKTDDQNAVALPEARRRGDSGEERCFSITPDQMQTILERVVDKIFSEKIEKILTDVIERAVADEMRKLESYFFEELDDRGDR